MPFRSLASAKPLPDTGRLAEAKQFRPDDAQPFVPGVIALLQRRGTGETVEQLQRSVAFDRGFGRCRKDFQPGLGGQAPGAPHVVSG